MDFHLRGSYEQRFLTLVMAEQDGGTSGKARTSSVDWRSFWAVATNWQVYLQIFVHWSNTVPNYALKFTMPTIIKGMGFTSSNAQLSTIPAYVKISISGSIKKHIGPCYFAICLACIGFYPISPGGTTWLSNNTAGPAKRAVSLAYLTAWEAPKYPTGYGSSIAFAGADLVAATLLELNFIRINKQRGKLDEDEIREKYTNEQLVDMGDRSPLFRYIL
ncbi:uncharacterized protein L201_000254 [Kwoniella dendrophila CBS 6074]|uniref:Uncharacterized protein n=1 Tax=Kwoniella dendrophila CBS 6074 TaxID=1295534 RepID=A0AAX4JIW6_9TREE